MEELQNQEEIWVSDLEVDFGEPSTECPVQTAVVSGAPLAGQRRDEGIQYNEEKTEDISVELQISYTEYDKVARQGAESTLRKLQQLQDQLDKLPPLLEQPAPEEVAKMESYGGRSTLQFSHSQRLLVARHGTTEFYSALLRENVALEDGVLRIKCKNAGKRYELRVEDLDGRRYRAVAPLLK